MFKQKVMMILRKVPKVLGIILLVSAVLFVGFQLFLSMYFKPHDVRLTNVTDTSFTVSWITNYPMRGIVYYKEKDSILPGILSWIGTKRAYDDRDIAWSQRECVEKFNKEAKVSEDFVVDTSKYSCNQVKVKKTGKYFTHHATLTDLEPNKEYYFRIGDGIFSYKGDINKSAIFLPLRGEVKAPAPIFGKIVNDKGEYVNDSVVYIKFINGYLGKESMYYSSVTARDGSWYLDSNNIRTIEGEPIIVEDKQDMIKVYAQYQNYILSDSHDWVYGNSGFAYPDIVVKDSWEKDLSALPNEENGIYVGWVKGVSASDLTKGNMVEGAKKLNQILKREHTVSDGSTSLITESVKREGKNKGFREMFVENIQVWEYVLFGVFLLSFVILLIFWLKKRNTAVFFRIRKGYGALQVLLLTVPVVYLGIKVNTVQNLSSEKSHAGCHETNSCGSWAELVESKAESGNAEDRQWAEERQEQMRKDEELFGSNASHLKPGGQKDSGSTNGCPKGFQPTGLNGECEKVQSSGAPTPNSSGKCKYGNLSACNEKDLKANINNWGAGNVHAELTRRYGNDPVKAACELNWCNNTTQLAGNLHATTGVGVKADEISSALDCGNACTKKDLVNLSATVKEDANGNKSFDLGKKGTGGGVTVELPLIPSANTYPDKTIRSKEECQTKQGKWHGEECYVISTSNLVTSSATIVKLGDYYYWEVPRTGKKVRLNITAEEAKGLCKGESVTNKCDGVQLHYSQVANIGMLYNILLPFQQTKLTDYIKETHNTILGTDNSFYLKEDGVFIKNVDGHLIVTQKNGQPYDGKVTVTEDLKKLFPQLANYDIGEKINIADSLKVLNQIVYSYDDGDKRGDTANSQADVTLTFTKKVRCHKQENNEFACKVDDTYLDDIPYSLKEQLENNAYCNTINSNDCILYCSTVECSGVSRYYESAKDQQTNISVYYDSKEGKYMYMSDGFQPTSFELNRDDDFIIQLSTQCGKDLSTIVEGDACSVVVNKSDIDGRLGITDSVLGTTDITSSNNGSTNTLGSGYITYLPEYGFFDMEIEGLKETEKVEGNTLRIFYVETNGVEGFQPPADPDNPKKTEDIMLQSSSLNISYKKSAEVMTLDLKRGVNLVSFNYIPKIENNKYSKASSLLKWLLSKGVRVEHISYFSGGRWKGIGYVDGKTTGDDFNVTPGKGYLIYTEADAKVNIPGYKITSSVPVPLGAGWNLIGVHGYNEMYTAKSLIDSINSIDGLTANNVSWWPTSKGKYEGLQVVDGKQYGFDFSISSNNGYFVRISKFAPKDSKCKSLLWHAGGSHNGACGGSK